MEKIMFSPVPLEELVCAIANLINENKAVNSAVQPVLINRFELCQRLGITEAHAIRLEKKGVIPVIRLGSSIRYNWISVVAALEKEKGGASL